MAKCCYEVEPRRACKRVACAGPVLQWCRQHAKIWEREMKAAGKWSEKWNHERPFKNSWSPPLGALGTDSAL